MIQISNISKSFGNRKEKTVLKHVQLNVPNGSIYGLLGANGAGKTTLLKTIVGLYESDSGQVLFDGRPVFEQLEVKRSLCYIPDELYFFPQSTIRQMANFYKSMFATWDEQRFVALQELFVIPVNTKIHKLSKGMQRQVSFWLALACKPKYLILDEPLDGLDSIMRTNMKKLLFQEVAERELTVLLSSHNLREIEDMCDHIGILHEGEIIIEQDLDELRSGICKLQVAFAKPEHAEQFKATLEVLHAEQRGNVHNMIIKDSAENIEQCLAPFTPIFQDRLPMTLDEIFISVLGGKGYEITDIFL